MAILIGWVFFCVAVLHGTAVAEDHHPWWNTAWRYRTTVCRSAPWREATPRPVEVAIDFPRLLKAAGIEGRFDPRSLRVVARGSDGQSRLVPFVYRPGRNSEKNSPEAYLAWIARPKMGEIGTYDVYFETQDRGIKPARFPDGPLPPENLLANPGFEEAHDGLPDRWRIAPAALVQLGRFSHTSGERSLKVVVDERSPGSADREVAISQQIDVRSVAGQEMVFECDLFAERAAYGAPVCIELEQFRHNGSRILEYAVQPRWLTLELAEGQPVHLSQRGRFSPEAARVNVKVRMRCFVRDADSGQRITGPESYFTIWMDRVVVRPGRRWPYPPEAHGGFVEGALEVAPLSRAFEFVGRRRLALNGASEGTLTAGRYNPDPNSVHWGLQRGTLEFWCRTAWDAADGREHVFFEGIAYGHRLQSLLRKRGSDGDNHLEFAIADSGGTLRRVRARAPFRAGRWHHVAATWDFPAASLQLYFDGQCVATGGSGGRPWPSSRVPERKGTKPGIGIMGNDSRSLPMQAFLGGDRGCSAERSAEAALDELRISSAVRYDGAFSPSRREFVVDTDTRALFHFENERHGTHQSDDRFVFGHLACELPRYQETVPVDSLSGEAIRHRRVMVRPRAPKSLFQQNRAENRLTVTRPFRRLPDPRFVEYRVKSTAATVHSLDDEMVVAVGGDHQPWMRSITFRHAGQPQAQATLLPRWRANENIVPFSFQTLKETLAPNVKTDARKALEVFRYALETSNYYDAHICETLPARHRSRVSYTLTKALNIYAFDQCGPLNYTLRKMFLAGGISSNDASGTHHQFEQGYCDGDFRMFDLSPRMYWLMRDDRSVAGRRTFEEDLWLKLRQDSSVTSAIPGRVSRARFGVAERPHAMDFALRPGESAAVCWHNEGRWIEIAAAREPIPLGKIPPYFGNGAIVFRPGGGRVWHPPIPPTARHRREAPVGSEAALLENLVVERADDDTNVLRPEDPSRPASLVYRAAAAYVFSDARVRGTCAGDVRLALSFDEGESWTEVWKGRASGSMDVGLRDRVMGRYAFWLKIELAGGDEPAAVRDLAVRSTFVVSPLALPGKLSQGVNRVRFVGGPVSAPVLTEATWVERHQADLGVQLNVIGYYLNGDAAHRNLFVVAPEEEFPVEVRLLGRIDAGHVSLEGLPAGWSAEPKRAAVKPPPAGHCAAVEFRVRPCGRAREGDIHAFSIATGQGNRVRRVPAQLLVAAAPLVREAENADGVEGGLDRLDQAELSGAAGIAFAGDGRLLFDVEVPRARTYALWLRARWEPGSGAGMSLCIDREKRRSFSATAMIGFTHWSDPRRAHTKMFAHFGEQYGHWSWYRLGDVELKAGEHRLALTAGKGARFDALLLLPQTPSVDRAAMNLLQNWNYAPWDNPL